MSCRHTHGGAYLGTRTARGVELVQVRCRDCPKVLEFPALARLALAREKRRKRARRRA